MLSPREKYLSDPKYRAMVDMIETYLHTADYTPSEIREMAVLACINYEMKSLRKYPIELEDALNKIHTYTNRK